MQSLSLSARNSSKVSQNLSLVPVNIDPSIVNQSVTFQPLKPDKPLIKSRIRTGLTPRIERRNLSSDFQQSEIETSSPSTTIPSKDYKSQTGLEKGIHIRKLKTKLNSSTATERLQNYFIAHREREQRELPILKESSNEAINQQIPFRESFLIIQKSKFTCIELQTRRRTDCNSSIKKPIEQSHDFTILRQTPMAKRKTSQKVEKISVKHAIRDKEWITRARPQIIKSFIVQLNKSNGLTMELPIESFFNYKYYLGKGNNSNLVKQCLSSRWWWTRVGEEDISTAHFVWTQWKDKKIIEMLPMIQKTHQIESRLAVTVTSNARYHSPSLHSRPKIVDIAPLGYSLITRSKHFVSLASTTYNSTEMKLYSKIEHNFHLANKKALFYNLKNYFMALGQDPFSVIPVTFHVQSVEDAAFAEFEAYYKSCDDAVDSQGKKSANIWIVKPGENSNRGNGISVCIGLENIKNELRSNPHPPTGKHTYIIQKYLEKPFLVNKRKFDIRCFALITCFNCCMQAYFYSEGYLRTASKIFSLQATNKFVHLTNDAVQKHSEDYGKYENGNKMSYTDFQRYLDNHYSERSLNFCEEIVPQIKNIVRNTIEATFSELDPKKRGHSFEIFGYDFLLDSDLKPWLLEVNTNPCLELSSTHLARIIPNMLENAFRIALDPIFQEPISSSKHFASTNDIPENKFELIFHSELDGEPLIQRFSNLQGMDRQEIEELCNDPEEIQDSDSDEVN